MNTVDILVVISLALFYILMFGRTLLLYRKGIKVWVIGTSTQTIAEILLEKILLPFALVISCVFIVIAALHIRVPALIAAPVIHSVRLPYIGLLLCYSGLLIFLLALLSFGKAWRIGIDESNSHELITTGMFKYSRNPIFLFMDMYFIGILCIYPTIIFIALPLGTITGIHFQILREEAFLIKKFGEQYRAYKKTTRRYF